MSSAATRRLLLVGGTLLALLALVALAARGHVAGSGGGQTRHVHSGLLEYAWLLAPLSALTAVCVLVLGLVEAKHDPSLLPKRGNWMRRLFVAMLGATLAAISYAHYVQHHHHRVVAEKPLGRQGSVGHVTGSHPTGGRAAGLDSLPVTVVLSIAIAGAAIAMFFFLRAVKVRPREGRQVAGALAAALDESLDDLRRERDARRAVIAAYARMERALAASGLPRRAAEAPLEYLARVLGDFLRTSAESVARLTALFERAKFSTHEIGPDLKDEAIAALGAVREELRAVS